MSPSHHGKRKEVVLETLKHHTKYRIVQHYTCMMLIGSTISYSGVSTLESQVNSIKCTNSYFKYVINNCVLQSVMLLFGIGDTSSLSCYTHKMWKRLRQMYK